jgi:hypothetical protein
MVSPPHWSAVDRDAMALVLSRLLFVPLENNNGLLGNSATCTNVNLALAGCKLNNGFILWPSSFVAKAFVMALLPVTGGTSVDVFSFVRTQVLCLAFCM